MALPFIRRLGATGKIQKSVLAGLLPGIYFNISPGESLLEKLRVQVLLSKKELSWYTL
jgi:hypothetical protein